MSKEVDINALSKGQNVVFMGWSDPEDAPENGNLLEKGEVYEIIKVNPETSEIEATAEIGAPNPNFDSSRKNSKANPEKLTFMVFGNEISLDGVDVAPKQTTENEPVRTGGKGTPKKTAPKKTVSEKKAPAKKAATSKTTTTPSKTATKKAAASKTTSSEKTAPSKKKTITKKKAAKPTSKSKAAQSATKKTGTKSTQKGPATKGKKGTSSLTSRKDVEESYDEDKILILSDEEEDQDVLALVNEAADIIALAQDEIEDASLTEFRLGGVLYHVKKSKAYKEHDNGKYAGKGGWAAFVSDVLGMEYRKAMYLIDIYTKFSKYGIPATEAARMGWTKAAVIAAPMDADNAEDLVRYAEEQTVTDLKETVKEIRTSGSRQVVKKTTFKFRLAEDSGVAVRELLEQAKISLGEHNDDTVFEHIITEWASEHLDVSSQQKAKRRGKSASRSKK